MMFPRNPFDRIYKSGFKLFADMIKSMHLAVVVFSIINTGRYKHNIYDPYYRNKFIYITYIKTS